MTEEQTERSIPAEQSAEKKVLSTADAQAARTASVADVNEVQKTNPNKFESMTKLPTIKDGMSLEAAQQSFGINMGDDTAVTATGIEAPAAKKKASVDPRLSYVEGLKAVGNDEEAQGRFSIEYMERKGKEALAAAQKPADEQVLIASNLIPTVPDLEQMQQYDEIQSDSAPATDYAPDQVISRDWGASLKKGWDRTVQSVQHPDLIGWENPPEGGDAIYPRRGREDDFIDYDACSKANKAFVELAKYVGDGAGKIDPDLIAATIRNEQFYFDNTKDAGPENYVQKHRNWPFNRDESVGPAQMQVQNMEHLAKTYPKQLGSVADAVHNAIDIHHAPDFVGAYFADVIHGIETKQKPDYISDKIWKQINDRWQKGQRNEALIIAYNPDPNQINHVFTQLDNIKAPDWD